MSKKDEAKLLQQATIVSAMMIALARGFHGDYRRKHVGAVWEELLVAFMLWKSDTMKQPMTIMGISNDLGIPRTNVSRAVAALLAQGLVCKINRRYGRNVGFISVRPNSRFFREIREAVMKAGRELEVLYR